MILLKPERPIPLQRLAGEAVTICLRVKLPLPQRHKSLTGKGVKNKYDGPGKLVPVLFGLTKNQLEKLENEVKKTHSNRSNICRKALDTYWLMSNKVDFSYKGYHKYPILGLKNISVTIRQDQAGWLKAVLEKTGKRLSEVGREALEFYFSEKRDGVDLPLKTVPLES